MIDESIKINETIVIKRFKKKHYKHEEKNSKKIANVFTTEPYQKDVKKKYIIRYCESVIRDLVTQLQ